MTSPMKYEVPLRPDFNALLVLPRDLTIKEVIRLTALLESLVIPDPPIVKGKIVNLDPSAEGEGSES